MRRPWASRSACTICELRERQLEVARLEAVEPLDRDVQVAALAVPVLQELVRAAVHVAARQHDVAVADQVREHRVDRRHARVEVPGEVLARERPRLDVDDVVRQARRGRVHEPRVDLVQELLALERVVDPLGARVQVGGGARDDRRRAEDRRHVVEHRVRARAAPRRARWRATASSCAGGSAACRAAWRAGSRGSASRSRTRSGRAGRASRAVRPSRPRARACSGSRGTRGRRPRRARGRAGSPGRARSGRAARARARRRSGPRSSCAAARARGRWPGRERARSSTGSRNRTSVWPWSSSTMISRPPQSVSCTPRRSRTPLRSSSAAAAATPSTSKNRWTCSPSRTSGIDGSALVHELQVEHPVPGADARVEVLEAERQLEAELLGVEADRRLEVGGPELRDEVGDFHLFSCAASSAHAAAFRGVAIPCRAPRRTTTPLRASSSSGRPARRS